ncbi:receptor kinase-like protein Xa21 [Impatiens glandulifera]|uniref:receptor kinase-like protein Xa21 n=1 Tax=Impatiens glandulifera TaxID=253017 RepID=UPI001FB1027E|nr:receptor kinase-like protein Xa21 [Impatiens glandulifera]
MSNRGSLMLCCWLLMLVCSAMCGSNVTDQTALLNFKSKLDFFNPILNQNWTTSTSFCNWVGVSCSSSPPRQRVTSLSLTDMNLTGPISPFIGNLSFLIILNLRNNQLHGHLSPEIGRLKRLKFINLQDNKLQGPIPPTLSNCQHLKTISFYNNQFDNVIPKELGYLPNLQTLYLGGSNNLRGSFPSTLSNLSTTLQHLSLASMGLTSIPPFLFNMSSLLELYLFGNSISSEIPMDFCQYFPKLQFLIMYNNQLYGELPSEISQCQELMELDLANNNFHGIIPRELGTLPKLELISLGNNNFNGGLPPELSNASALKSVWLEGNNIQGNIPDQFGLLLNLVDFNMDENNLTGVIPPSLFNISTLQILNLARNDITGQLSTFKLPSLQELYISKNQVSGNIPESITNSTKLFRIEIAFNMLSGTVPKSIGNLRSLQLFSVGSNRLTGERDGGEIDFISNMLRNCRFLVILALQLNPLNGFLPYSIGNSSSSLQIFWADGCRIQGSIPPGIGSLKKLNYLSLSYNNITGTVPPTIRGMQSLQRLNLDENNIEGFIPDQLCHLQNLGDISLQGNNLSGPIPSCMYNITRLQKLFLSSNKLESSIPQAIWSLKDLIVLNLSSNSLSGELPVDINMLDSLENIDISQNMIAGDIPSSFGEFRRLDSINLSHNLLQGSIPVSLGGLVTLTTMDLSHNELTGNIPASLDSITSLSYLNLSYNKLSGEIPFSGPFEKFKAESFMGNEDLCAHQYQASLMGVKPCKNMNDNKKLRRRIKKILLRYIVPAMTFLLIAFAVVIIVFQKYRRRDNKKNRIPDIMEPDMHDHKMVSYAELVGATENFSESNLLGSGSYGSVYKGILSGAKGTIVAVKVLNLHKEGAYKSFDAECRVLRTVRHRNLVKVITTCSNPEFRALILQYMPNGSLEKWLHTQDYQLDLIQRLTVMLDVAMALEYLHHGQFEPVIHCDIKPSNVLLDEEMVGHLGDFGIAKIIAEEEQTFVNTKTLGTIGYMAPEYGSEGMVSTSGDVYSYGIMLMETLTGKKPTEEMFSEIISLREWVNESYKRNSVLEVIDATLIVLGKEDCCSSIIQVALNCSADGPGERITMKEVVLILSKIKQKL